MTKDELMDKALRGDYVAQGENDNGVIYTVVQSEEGFHLITENMGDVRVELLPDDRVMNVVGMVGTLSVYSEMF